MREKLCVLSQGWQKEKEMWKGLNVEDYFDVEVKVD